MLHVFIINAFAAEGKYTDGIREKLASIPDFEYLAFNSEYAGHEAVLAKQIYEMFTEERIRFYACGGSGTFRNIFNAVPDISNVEFAEFPCGITNDFLKCFGDERDSFSVLENLIDGDVWKLDYIDTNMGRAHNMVSMGLDVEIGNSMTVIRKFPYFKGTMPNIISGLWALVFTKAQRLAVKLDSEIYDDNLIQIAIGNGSTLGGIFKIAEDRIADDNYLDAVIIRNVKLIRKCKAFAAQLNIDRKLNEKYRIIKRCRSFEIKSPEGKMINIDLDGEIMSCECVKGKVVSRGMNFVVPKNIKEKSYE